MNIKSISSGLFACNITLARRLGTKRCIAAATIEPIAKYPFIRNMKENIPSASGAIVMSYIVCKSHISNNSCFFSIGHRRNLHTSCILCNESKSEDKAENVDLISSSTLYPASTVKQIEYFLNLNAHACMACQKNPLSSKEGTQLQNEQEAVRLLWDKPILLSSEEAKAFLKGRGFDDTTVTNVIKYGNYLDRVLRGEKLEQYHEIGKQIANDSKDRNAVYHYHKYFGLCMDCFRLSTFYLV